LPSFYSSANHLANTQLSGVAAAAKENAHRLSWFCFVHPAQALLNSTPQFFARDRRAVAQGAQLGPGDLRMHSSAWATVRSIATLFREPQIRRRRRKAEWISRLSIPLEPVDRMLPLIFSFL
jgi:hypothetical protein